VNIPEGPVGFHSRVRAVGANISQEAAIHTGEQATGLSGLKHYARHSPEPTQLEYNTAEGKAWGEDTVRCHHDLLWLVARMTGD
jgi:hypothetical protein